MVSRFVPYADIQGDLFISEYIEGYSNNKAFEIYIPLEVTVDLSNYGILTSSNGGSWLAPEVLNGMLNPGDTSVIMNPNWGLFFTDTRFVDTLWGANATYYNGDDGRGLARLLAGD